MSKASGWQSPLSRRAGVVSASVRLRDVLAFLTGGGIALLAVSVVTGALEAAAAGAFVVGGGLISWWASGPSLTPSLRRVVALTLAHHPLFVGADGSPQVTVEHRPA